MGKLLWQQEFVRLQSRGKEKYKYMSPTLSTIFLEVMQLSLGKDIGDLKNAVDKLNALTSNLHSWLHVYSHYNASKNHRKHIFFKCTQQEI